MELVGGAPAMEPYDAADYGETKGSLSFLRRRLAGG
jgi:hypothetical protein